VLLNLYQARNKGNNMKNIFKTHRVLAIAISVVLSLALVGVVAATAISNLWVSPNIVVTAPVRLPLLVSSADFTADRAILLGEATFVGVRLQNPSPVGAPSYTGVTVNFSVYDSSDNVISLADVAIQYQVDATWYPLPLVQGAGVLTGNFGGAGFPVASGYDQNTMFKAVFNTAGNYHVSAQAVTI
jgi:hypothetical protein